MKQLTLTHQVNYNGWEVESDCNQEIIDTIDNHLPDMSIEFCDDEGYMSHDELPNEEAIISYAQSIVKEPCNISIEYDYISS